MSATNEDLGRLLADLDRRLAENALQRSRLLAARASIAALIATPDPTAKPLPGEITSLLAETEEGTA